LSISGRAEPGRRWRLGGTGEYLRRMAPGPGPGHGGSGSGRMPAACPRPRL